jgi:hypothetical protein
VIIAHVRINNECDCRILLFCDGVEMSFELPGNSMPHFKGQKKGRIYLTTHRVGIIDVIVLSVAFMNCPSYVLMVMPLLSQMIFNNKDNRDTLQSFSIPFYCMKEVELKQPVFGANYITGIVKAESGGSCWIVTLLVPLDIIELYVLYYVHESSVRIDVVLCDRQLGRLWQMETVV